MLFLAMFQVTVLMVNAADVFPSTFYDDLEVSSNIRNADSPEAAISWLLTPNIGAFGINKSPLTVGVIVAAFVGLGIAAAIFTHSFLPVVAVIIGYSFFNMLTYSYSFISKLFQWETGAMTYLALCLGVGLVFIVIVTIVELPTHGRSG